VFFVLEALSDALAMTQRWGEARAAADRAVKLALDLGHKQRAASLLESCGHMEVRDGWLLLHRDLSQAWPWT
jgi:hypothetical protein